MKMNNYQANQADGYNFKIICCVMLVCAMYLATHYLFGFPSGAI